MSDFLNREQFAAKYQIHPKTVSRYVRQRRLECQRVGRLLRFGPEHIEKFERSENRRMA